ncbi:MAG: hypothetical protein WBM59_03820, partial [Sedimenticolaceae bacterium]
MRKLLAIGLCALLASSAGSALAIDKSEVREKWHTPFDLYLSAREAYEMKTSRPDEVLFIDVR